MPPKPIVLSAEEVARRFSPTQIASWPTGYRPTAELARLLSSATGKPTLSSLIKAKASLASNVAKSAAAGPDDGSAAALSNLPAVASSSSASGKQYDYSVYSASPLSSEIPYNERAHTEAAFLDFMEGRDEQWLSHRFNMCSEESRLPKLPWQVMTVNRRKRTLKRITARDRPLPHFLEVCEFLNLPPPYIAADHKKKDRATLVTSTPSQLADDGLSNEDRLSQYLASVPEVLPCDIEITDYRAKGNRLSPGAGTVGVQMGSNATESPKAVNIAPVNPGMAAVGTYRHSVETAIKVHDREVARAARRKVGRVGSADLQPATLPLPPRFYDFTPYADQQTLALAPVSRCESLDDPVDLPTLQSLRNLLQMDCLNTYGVANYLASITGDGLVLTQEFVTELAMYLAKRWHELAARQGASDSTQGKSTAKPGPILLPFGNGRLAHYLNESGLLPTKAYATSRLPEKALYPAILSTLSDDGSLVYSFPSVSLFNTSTVRDKKLIANTLLNEDPYSGPDGADNSSETLPAEGAYSARYPIHTEVSIQDALQVYQPSIVIAEPHASRDYASDLRGCESVKEVLFIGPIDSPAMGSFSFPWLTFGVTPSPDTYELYNEQFQLQGKGAGGGGGGGMLGASRSMQMPMDPPYMAQGYHRVYLDRISALTILPNDSPEIPRQGRCLAFRRASQQI